MRIVICALLGLSWSAAIAENENPAQVAGIYEGTVPVKNGDGRKVTLNLKQDGVSEFRDGPKSVAGHWSAAGQQLRIVAEGGNAPMMWKIGKNAVTLQDASKAIYGKKGLVLRRPR